MSLCALIPRAIARSDTRCVVRAYTCVNSVKLPVCVFVEVYAEDRKIKCTVSGFEIFYFELLDPELQRVRSYVLQNFCSLLRKFYARNVMSCVYFEVFYFEPLHPEILTNKTQNIFYFELLNAETLTTNTQSIFGENVGPKTV